ncbi:cinnamyl alcohol dehydrogenase 1 [Zea mays]|nr:cinnamyl alcohol dehydrogenase 1 [Zea mays]ACF79133.1 unknown [Zea mays]ACF85779.1 unknown [Zea mays]ONM14023.1 cinnamyl alcohol dehydrogenase1 [Zea mays]|eukprot:NP_001130781.1 cinnamyl alcohol dehydrogenase 1 [Zea mays]
MAPVEAEQHRRRALALAAHDASGAVSPIRISRRDTGDDDVAIQILYCGICHSDLHTIKNEWKNANYPVVPGHEIAGLITEVGKNVKRFNVGDKVGVGCMVNTCQSCESCEGGHENYCSKIIFTYNSHDRDGTVTYGGYSDMVVVNERFVIRFPDGMPLDRGAPLLCAGITVYNPMKHHGLNEAGKHIGVVGLGGLGHVAVKFAKAFGMRVTVISTSPGKREEAMETLGADAFVVSGDANQMKAAKGTMDGIMNTASASMSMYAYLALLKPQGKMILLGLPEKPLQISAFSLVTGGKTLAGSCMGSIRDTQEMMDFAAKHGLAADIELIGTEEVNEAMERLAKGEVRYRFVIDIGNTLNAASLGSSPVPAL